MPFPQPGILLFYCYLTHPVRSPPHHHYCATLPVRVVDTPTLQVDCYLPVVITTVGLVLVLLHLCHYPFYSPAGIYSPFPIWTLTLLLEPYLTCPFTLKTVIACPTLRTPRYSALIPVVVTPCAARYPVALPTCGAAYLSTPHAKRCSGLFDCPHLLPRLPYHLP